MAHVNAKGTLGAYARVLTCLCMHLRVWKRCDPKCDPISVPSGKIETIGSSHTHHTYCCMNT